MKRQKDNSRVCGDFFPPARLARIWIILDHFENFMSPSQLMAGNFVWIFSILIQFKESFVKVISPMTCNISEHSEYSCTVTNYKYSESTSYFPSYVTFENYKKKKI